MPKEKTDEEYAWPKATPETGANSTLSVLLFLSTLKTIFLCLVCPGASRGHVWQLL